MADPWEEAAKQFKPQPQTAATPASAPSDDWKIWQHNGDAGPQGGAVQRFTGSLADTLNPVPMLKSLSHFREPGAGTAIAKGLVQPQIDEFKKAGAAMSDPQGGSLPMRMSTAFGHGLAGLTPIVGPMAAKAGEQFGSGDIAGGAGTATGLLAPFALHATVPRAIDAIPSTARAGENFDKVMQVARNEPIDVSKPGDIALRSQTASQFGHPSPAKPIRDFLRETTTPGNPPLTYEQGRPFASSAGDLSSKTTFGKNRTQLGNLKQFAGAMDEANRDAADRAGVAEPYDAAMKEYRQAQQLKSFGKAAVKGAALGGAGYAAKKGIIDRLIP